MWIFIYTYFLDIGTSSMWVLYTTGDVTHLINFFIRAPISIANNNNTNNITNIICHPPFCFS